MRIHEFLKKIFNALILFTVLGLISMIPMDNYQKSFKAEQQKIYTTPQKHINATEKYVEAVFDGEEDISNGIKPRAPKKYYNTKPYKKFVIIKKRTTQKARKYSRPLYVRDKNNPKILRRYRKNRFR